MAAPTTGRKLNVAMIGYAFMGRAHSNAWRQVGRFFDVPYEPVMKVLCGRDRAAAREAAQRLGWEEIAVVTFEDELPRRNSRKHA